MADPIALCLIDFDEDTVKSSTDGPPGVVERLFNNTGESGKFRTFRNRLLFLVANRQELERAINLAREYRAIDNILKSPNRLEDLSDSQQKQLKQKKGEMDLNVRVALTNAYRHLFYPSNDSVKAAKGLMHYPLSAQDAGDVKNNQQDVILKALKDCQKLRAEEAPPFAPAYVLQKVWAAGLDHWTTKALREAFAKDLGLNILLDAEIPKLRETIRQGLQAGQWDLKVGDRVFIKTDEGLPALPDTIEFSERMVLYRRGILEAPKPREVEFNAQVMPSTESTKPVRLRWRAQGALSVSLYQDGNLVRQDFRPSDEYEGTIAQTTVFRVVADYGNGETAQAEATAKVVAYAPGGGSGGGSSGGSPTVSNGATLFTVKPEQFDLEGTPNSVFSGLSDRVHDHKVKGIMALELSVSQVMDYRKLTTALPLLAKYPILIDQTVTMQTGDQFVRLEYQGPLRGFQSFLNPTKALLDNSDVQANVMLKLVIAFASAVEPQGQEIEAIAQALGRNPVDRLNLTARVTY